MAWASLSLAKKLTGVPEDIREEDFAEIVALADNFVLGDLSVKREDETPYGSITGSNKYFYLDYFPVADSNFDGVADAKDIEVYFWTDGADFSTKTLQSNTSYTLEGTSGKITFTTAPTSDVERITVTYSYLKNPIPVAQLQAAASLVAAAYYSMSEYSLLPSDYGLGVVRIKRRWEPWDKLMEQYENLKLTMVQKPMATPLPESLPESDTDTRKRRLMERDVNAEV